MARWSWRSVTGLVLLAAASWLNPCIVQVLWQRRVLQSGDLVKSSHSGLYGLVVPSTDAVICFDPLEGVQERPWSSQWRWAGRSGGLAAIRLAERYVGSSLEIFQGMSSERWAMWVLDAAALRPGDLVKWEVKRHGKVIRTSHAVVIADGDEVVQYNVLGNRIQRSELSSLEKIGGEWVWTGESGGLAAASRAQRAWFWHLVPTEGGENYSKPTDRDWARWVVRNDPRLPKTWKAPSNQTLSASLQNAVSMNRTLPHHGLQKSAVPLFGVPYELGLLRVK